MTSSTDCPLCSATEAVFYCRDKRREYLRCPQCALVYVPTGHYLSLAAERAEYDKHQNDVEDTGYRKFLSRFSVPLQQCLSRASSGLDFGCGPGPALAQMLREAGHEMEIYDPFYAPDRAVLEQVYDFICATEVVEHMHRPGEELSMLWNLLKGGGCLGVMTKLVLNQSAFASWHYKNDPTHVCFFSRETWRWWAGEYRAQLSYPAADVILLTKPGAG